MGFFDFLTGGSGPDKANKLKAKATQKYGDPTTRQKAILQLGEMNIPEAVLALMARFTITVEPGTTDADEKEQIFDLVKGKGQDAVEPVKEFLRKSEQASSWALRILEALLPEPEVIGTCVELLEKLGRVHKDQVFAPDEHHEHAADHAPAGPKGEAASAKPGEEHEGAKGGDEHDGAKGGEEHEEEGSAGTLLLKWYFIIVALALTTSTCLGLWIGLTHFRHKRIGWVLLLIGILLPALLITL